MADTTDAPGQNKVWLNSGAMTDTSRAAVAKGGTCISAHHGSPPNGTLGATTVVAATASAGATSASMYTGGDMLANNMRYFTTNHIVPIA